MKQATNFTDGSLCPSVTTQVRAPEYIMECGISAYSYLQSMCSSYYKKTGFNMTDYIIYAPPLSNRPWAGADDCIKCLENDDGTFKFKLESFDTVIGTNYSANRYTNIHRYISTLLCSVCPGAGNSTYPFPDTNTTPDTLHFKPVACWLNAQIQPKDNDWTSDANADRFYSMHYTDYGSRANCTTTAQSNLQIDIDSDNTVSLTMNQLLDYFPVRNTTLDVSQKDTVTLTEFNPAYSLFTENTTLPLKRIYTTGDGLADLPIVTIVYECKADTIHCRYTVPGGAVYSYTKEEPTTAYVVMSVAILPRPKYFEVNDNFVNHPLTTPSFNKLEYTIGKNTLAFNPTFTLDEDDLVTKAYIQSVSDGVTYNVNVDITKRSMYPMNANMKIAYDEQANTAQVSFTLSALQAYDATSHINLFVSNNIDKTRKLLYSRDTQSETFAWNISYPVPELAGDPVFTFEYEVSIVSEGQVVKTNTIKDTWCKTVNAIYLSKSVDGIGFFVQPEDKYVTADILNMTLPQDYATSDKNYYSYYLHMQPVCLGFHKHASGLGFSYYVLFAKPHGNCDGKATKLWIYQQYCNDLLANPKWYKTDKTWQHLNCTTYMTDFIASSGADWRGNGIRFYECTDLTGIPICTQSGPMEYEFPVIEDNQLVWINEKDLQPTWIQVS